MQQIKVFKNVESDLEHLEREVNQWLAESQARVVNMFGNIAPQTQTSKQSTGLSNSVFAPSDVLLVILYETD